MKVIAHIEAQTDVFSRVMRRQNAANSLWSRIYIFVYTSYEFYCLFINLCSFLIRHSNRNTFFKSGTSINLLFEFLNKFKRQTEIYGIFVIQ